MMLACPKDIVTVCGSFLLACYELHVTCVKGLVTSVERTQAAHDTSFMKPAEGAPRFHLATILKRIVMLKERKVSGKIPSSRYPSSQGPFSQKHFFGNISWHRVQMFEPQRPWTSFIYKWCIY